MKLLKKQKHLNERRFKAHSCKQSSALPSLSFQPVISCSASQDNGQCQFAPTTLSVTARGSVPTSPNEGWSSANNTPLNVSWSAGDGSLSEFSFNQLELHFAKPGGSISLSDRNYAGFLLGFSSLRCDKG
jgi:hypothetical protein